MGRWLATGICLVSFPLVCLADADKPLLIRHPTIGRDKVASYKKPEYPNYQQKLPK
jgi:hypothetical protein